MAQLSLFDATPPEPQVPRPPSRGKKGAVKPVAPSENLASEVTSENNEQVMGDGVAPSENLASEVTSENNEQVVGDEVAPSENLASEVTSEKNEQVMGDEVAPVTEPSTASPVIPVPLPAQAASTAFHFEPAPIYTDTPTTVWQEPEPLPSSQLEEVLPSQSAPPINVVNEEEIKQLLEPAIVEEPDHTLNTEVDTSDINSVNVSAEDEKIKEANVPTELGNEHQVPSVDTTQLTKQYYSISEVSAMFKVNASHLRYWEKEFPAQLGKVRKNGKGDRFYTPKNIEQLQVLFYLVKTKKMTLEGARDYLKHKKRGAKANMDTLGLLQQVRGFLVGLKNELDQ